MPKSIISKKYVRQSAIIYQIIIFRQLNRPIIYCLKKWTLVPYSGVVYSAIRTNIWVKVFIFWTSYTQKYDWMCVLIVVKTRPTIIRFYDPHVLFIYCTQGMWIILALLIFSGNFNPLFPRVWKFNKHILQPTTDGTITSLYDVRYCHQGYSKLVTKGLKRFTCSKISYSQCQSFVC